MNRLVRVFILSALSLLLAVAVVSDGFARVYENNATQPQPYMIKGRVTIQFEDDVDLKYTNAMQKSFGAVSFNLPSLDALLSKNQVSTAAKVFPLENEKPAINSGMIDLTRYYEIRFPEELDVKDVINELSQNPNLRMAEPVWAIPVAAAPNDPEWSNQWAMEPGPPDPNFYTAWDYETGSDSIKFALIDSGILYNHRDLTGNIWVNPGEDIDGDGVVYDIDDLNGVDDDGNGIIDDVIGYDFFSGFGGLGIWPGEDGNTPDTDPSDFGGHGTHVAGIAAAMNNNGTDVTGAAGGWYGGHRSFRGVEIICCRVGATADDGNGYVNTNNCATAINYAVQMGVNVINASWGGSSTSAAAASNAVAAGVTFCHAAGNDNTNTPDNIDFVNGVISVASTGPSSDNKSSFSNWGSWIDVSAPGSSIRSTYSFSYTPGVATIGGTSMASPMTAGLALLIRSQMPSLSREQVDSIILATADSASLYAANPTYTGLLGEGRIDAFAALNTLPNAKFTADVTQGTAPLDVQFTDLSPNSPVAWDWSFGDGGTSTVQDPLHTYTNPGIYTVSLVEDEGHVLGNGEEHLRNYIWVTQDTLRLDSIDTPFDQEVVLPIYLKNTALVKEIEFVFSYANNMDVAFDSASVVGARTDYFEDISLSGLDLFNKRAAVLLRSNITAGSNYLPIDTGVVLNLHFTVGNNGNMGVLTIDTTTFNGIHPRITTIWGDYFPASFTPGKINIGGCCIGIRGNINGDVLDEINIADLVFLVDYSFGSPTGPTPDCFEEADVDGSLGLDIADIVYMVAYMFGSPTGPAPVDCY